MGCFFVFIFLLACVGLHLDCSELTRSWHYTLELLAFIDVSELLIEVSWRFCNVN